MPRCPRVRQLPTNAHPVAVVSDRPLQHIAYRQFTRGALHVDNSVLVGAADTVGDDEQPGETSDCGRDVFGHAVREIVERGSAPTFLHCLSGKIGDASYSHLNVSISFPRNGFVPPPTTAMR